MSNRAPLRNPTRKVGVLDLGSNTVLLLVMDESADVVTDEARITRLGQGVFASGRLHPLAWGRTSAAVEELSALARRHGVERVIAVGTEALRRAGDGAEFLGDLRTRGLVDEVRLLSGAEEARYAVEASLRSAPGTGTLTVVDVGGGSTEVSCAEPARPVLAHSMPLGSVRLTERWVTTDPVSSRELESLREAARSEASGLDLPPAERVVAVAGTATTLAALEISLEPYDPDRVEGMELSASQLDGWILRLAGMSTAERVALPGLEPGRADVIVAGAVILAEVVAALGARRFRVSGRGVRFGVALEWLGA
jgi:exopolyphosphatase/guanosine-5'-triphosphate,3'-diphosphate pyrophosphatase